MRHELLIDLIHDPGGSGHVWFGTASVGLCRYDGQVLSWMFEDDLTTTPSGGAFGIRSIYQDRSGGFWICNTRQRFEISGPPIRKDGYSLVGYKEKPGLPKAQPDEENFQFYSAMTEDSNGNLWMACGDSGVWRFDGKAVKRFPLGSDAYAISVYCDRGGTLWVGTLESGV